MPINDVQTTNRQHAVPQNIMDVEFKIIGDLTMRQFIYLLIFGALGYGIFIGLNNFLKWPLILFCAMAGIAFAFLPIQERGMDQWVINFFKAMYMPPQRVWRKQPEIPVAFSFENMDVVRQELITLTPTSSRRKLEEFLERQSYQQQEDPLDIQEYEYVDKLRSVFSTTTVVDTPVSAPATTTPVDTHQAPPAKPPEPVIPQEPAHDQPSKSKPKADEKPQAQEQPQEPSIKPVEHIEPEKPKKKLLSEIKHEKKEHGYQPLRPITPDRHTGRKFTNLLPKQGEIVLPIRGEKILQSTDEEKIQADIDEKAQQLKQLLDQIKSDEQYSQIVSQNKEISKELENTVNEAQQVVNQELQQDSTPQNQPAQEPVRPETPPQALQKDVTPAPMPQKEVPKESIPAATADINPLSNKPNIISGIVRDDKGSPLSGLVLIVKNDKDEPVRALKTNQVGQFAISTPLSNGVYTIETDKSKKTQFTFDIINFEAMGAVIPPVEIVGRSN